MTEHTAFTQAWMEAQQKFWDTWGDMSREAIKQNGQMPNWSEGFNTWWKQAENLAPPESRAMFERFVEQGKQFFQFNENFLKQFPNMDASKAGAAQWQAFWDQSLTALRSQMGKLAGGSLYDPLGQWQQFASHMGMNNGMPDMMHNWQEQFQKMLGMPGVGYTREWQEDMQKVTSLWLEHQKANREYAEIFAKVGANTVTRLQNKLASFSGSENPISTLRELYDLWIDCAEDAYAEMVITDEYSEINARLVNTMMAYKQQARSMLDESLGMMNLPTRRELDSVHQRLQAVRRQQKATAKTDTSALQAELDELREEIAELKKKPTSTVTRKPTAK